MINKTYIITIELSVFDQYQNLIRFDKNREIVCTLKIKPAK